MTEEEIKFARSQIDLAKYLQSLSPQEEINELCSMNGCNEEKRNVHAQLFLRRRWNPHPSERFVRWWENRGWQYTEGATLRGWSTWSEKNQTNKPISAAQAYNCEAVREVYREFLKSQRAEMGV